MMVTYSPDAQETANLADTMTNHCSTTQCVIAGLKFKFICHILVTMYVTSLLSTSAQKAPEEKYLSSAWHTCCGTRHIKGETNMGGNFRKSLFINS